MYHLVYLNNLNCKNACLVVVDSATLWTPACQAPLSMKFFRQEYWSRWPFPFPGDLPDQGIEPSSLVSPELADEFFINAPPGNNLNSVD